MTRRPKVSCVLIFFNGEAFINEAICSVVAQQGFDDWELILVDDGSTDSSTVIAQEWAASDPERIRYSMHPGHENRGMSAARNLGISLARGEFIGFLDCDDVWLPSALAHRMRVASSHPEADAVIGGTWRWYSWSGSADDFDRDHRMYLPRGLVPLTTIDPPALFDAIYGTPGVWFVPAMCSLLVRREALMAAGGLSQEFRGLHEDQVLYTKIALTMRVVLDSRPLALYRQHGSSACSTGIATGQWSPAGRSTSEDRFLEWQRHYVATSGASRTELDIVEANMARPDLLPAVEHSIDVDDSIDQRHSALARRTVGQLLGLDTWRLRRSSAHNVPAGVGPTVIGDWSAQLLSAWGSRRRGRVLVVIDQTAASEGWTSAIATEAVPEAEVLMVRRLSDPAADASFDHIIFTFGADKLIVPADLLAYCRSHLSPSGTISALFAGDAYRARRSITSTALRTQAAEFFSDRVVSVETFGNRVTAIAARGQRPASVAPGVTIDFHTADTEVMVALSIAPQVASRFAEVSR
jgi:hypothetical protein